MFGKENPFITFSYNGEDFKEYVKDRISESNNNYISEAGHKETWKGKIDEKRVDQHLSQVIEYLESLKK